MRKIASEQVTIGLVRFASLWFRNCARFANKSLKKVIQDSCRTKENKLLYYSLHAAENQSNIMEVDKGKLERDTIKELKRWRGG